MTFDSHQHDHSHAHSEGILEEIGDFGCGLVHGGIETPVNGLLQCVNEATGAHIPKLELVDDDRARRSVGGQLGDLAGGVFDCLGFAACTGGVGALFGIGGAAGAGSATMLGTALRMGAAGAVYSGLLTPIEGHGAKFWLDRAENGLIGFGTFASAGVMGGALNATGMFAVPAARSIIGSAAYGGITGASMGVVHSELNATIKKQQLLPDWKDVQSDTLSYGALGAAFGVGDNLYTRATLPKPIEIDTGTAKVSVQTDSAGNPIKVTESSPGEHEVFSNRYTKYADGSWGNDGDPFSGRTIAGVKLSPGRVEVSHGPEDVSYYREGQPFDSDYLRAQYTAKFKDSIGVPFYADLTEDGYVEHDYKGRLEGMRDSVAERRFDKGDLWQINSMDPDHNSVLIERAVVNNETAKLTFSAPGQAESFSVKLTDPARWQFDFGKNTYDFEGTLSVEPPATVDGLERLRIVPKGGEPVEMPLTSSAQNVREALLTFAKPATVKSPGYMLHW